MTVSNQSPPLVPREYAGRWIAWNHDRTAIVGSGPTFEEARRAAKSAGELEPVLAKAPRADVRFLGGVR